MRAVSCQLAKFPFVRCSRSDCMPGQGLKRLWTLPIDPKKENANLKVLQWNVLADGLAQNGDFVKVTQQALCWSYRAEKLLQLILEPQPDIVCLQEVNRYGDCLLPAMEKHGYTGAFFCKPCSPAEQYGAPCDGCALFYRSDRFDLCAEPQGQTFKAMDGSAGNQGMLMVHLFDRHSNTPICAATTHLKAKKAGQANDAIRDRQITQLMSELKRGLSVHTDESIAASGSRTLQGSSQRPLIFLCGDLNTTPDSSTCQLIARDPLQLRSSWDSYCSAVHRSGMQDQQPFSTWKFRSDGEWKRTIDYVWYSVDDRLQLVSHWQLPSEAAIGATGLPTLDLPSDHIALCCSFSIAK
ncbi:TPA: hypothetical protein ACH3X3_005610 [Trebouxia sp. C0006]